MILETYPRKKLVIPPLYLKASSKRLRKKIFFKTTNLNNISAVILGYVQTLPTCTRSTIWFKSTLYTFIFSPICLLHTFLSLFQLSAENRTVENIAL